MEAKVIRIIARHIMPTGRGVDEHSGHEPSCTWCFVNLGRASSAEEALLAVAYESAEGPARSTDRSKLFSIHMCSTEPAIACGARMGVGGSEFDHVEKALHARWDAIPGGSTAYVDELAEPENVLRFEL